MSNTFTRVGTANMYDNALRNLGERHSSLVGLQDNLTAGKRVVRPSDDPVAAAQAERALTRITRIQTEQRALEVQRNAISQAESSLGEAVNLVQEMRQLMVNAGSGTLTTNDRKTISQQLQSLRDQFFEVANRKDTNGLPL
ncbi:MAG: flagellin, partial [Giesbergeria sp.]